MIAATGLEIIRGVFIDPLSNPTATFVLIAIVSMTVLLALSLLLMALMRPPGRDEDRLDEEHETTDADARIYAADYEYPDLVPDEVVADLPVRHDETGDRESSERRDRHSRRLGCSSIVAIVAVALLIAGSAVTSTDAYCSRLCHAHGTAVATTAHDAHAGSSCVACHEDASLAGSIGAPFDRTGHALRRVWAGSGSQMAPVSSRSCLGCHRDIASRTVSSKDRGVRISHRAPLAAGMSCGDCHLGTGHSSGRAGSVSMRACSGCHNDRVAPATCATCHTQDPRSTPRPSLASLTYHAVPLGRSADCATCHDETSCDACHGLRLPHTADFVAWSHARDAAFGGRALCLRCHMPAACQKCHKGMGASAVDAHPADWRVSHQKQPAMSACECHWRRLPNAGRAGGTYCTVCH